MGRPPQFSANPNTRTRRQDGSATSCRLPGLSPGGRQLGTGPAARSRTGESRLAKEKQHGGSPHRVGAHQPRSEEHTSELPSLMRNSYAVLCLKKKTKPVSLATLSSRTTTASLART